MMSENLTPKPGELWETDCSWASVKRADGWYFTDGTRYQYQDQTPLRLVGYTAEHVERLRIERSLGVIQAGNDADALTEARVERDEAVARAEAAEVALADAEPLALDDLVEREPWRVLRAAAEVMDDDGEWASPSQLLRDTADRLEREAAETAKRDRLVWKARAAFTSTSGISSTATDGWMEAVVDAVLAEAVDDD